jgi:hypothetical protein
VSDVYEVTSDEKVQIYTTDIEGKRTFSPNPRSSYEQTNDFLVSKTHFLFYFKSDILNTVQIGGNEFRSSGCKLPHLISIKIEETLEKSESSIDPRNAKRQMIRNAGKNIIEQHTEF